MEISLKTNVRVNSDQNWKFACTSSQETNGLPSLESQLLSLVEITGTDFATLAAQRANRVKEYMINAGKVEPERVFLMDKPEDGNPAKGSRVYLHLR